jgi:hypothetical protein
MQSTTSQESTDHLRSDQKPQWKERAKRPFRLVIVRHSLPGVLREGWAHGVTLAIPGSNWWLFFPLWTLHAHGSAIRGCAHIQYNLRMHVIPGVVWSANMALTNEHVMACYRMWLTSKVGGFGGGFLLLYYFLFLNRLYSQHRPLCPAEAPTLPRQTTLVIHPPIHFSAPPLFERSIPHVSCVTPDNREWGPLTSQSFCTVRRCWKQFFKGRVGTVL